jgi:hypothetical protein
MEDTRSTMWISTMKSHGQGVGVAELNSTLSVAWGSSYVNDFLHQGRVKRSTCRPMPLSDAAGGSRTLVRPQ